MQRKYLRSNLLLAAAALAVTGVGLRAAMATEPCGDFGECKTLVEINATDGDIGFHFLMDGDDLNSAKIKDPNGQVIFRDRAGGALLDQKLTETFAESAEPLCRKRLKEEKDDEVVTLEQFLARWAAGTYRFRGRGDDGERSRGRTKLSHKLPAAPASVDFDGSVISWAAGDDLGACATKAQLDDLVADGTLPKHPEDVGVAAYEIVLEPDVEDGDPTGDLEFVVRVSGDIATKAVTVPADYLASLPDNTPAKIEVGAIGKTDNATFTEVVDFCINETTGC